MNTLSLNCFGITLTFEPANKDGASIESKMAAASTPDNEQFNAGVDGIESMILAHFCAGIDVNSPAYLEGIKTAYESLCNQYDTEEEEEPEDDNSIIVTQSRRVHAAVDETFNYEINKDDWHNALEDEGDSVEALDRLKNEGLAALVDADAIVDEVLAEHESEVFWE